ncbi:IS66 family transposase [Nonomuraea turcica]|uniref:IS66 family transposase n=1 Tax=Nonomuraea sp. G32 TaxID=3067274 RepID=UPI00273AEDDC|nr:IS66 family transposase [Nonomuraea sp. G32]MDP4510647.1 IS66 family transposase [Nonomuraea sp. G32]
MSSTGDPDALSREELLAALAERDAVIAALLAEIEQLKRRVGMDSSNSSMPPGSDGPAARAKRAKKPKKRSPRPRGGQPGHDGHALAWRTTPDQVTIVCPPHCAGCGHTLADLEGKVGARVQVFDTPPVKLQVTEYRMVQVACPACRRTTRAATPAGLAGPCCYGPNARAATALLACAGHMSISRAADLMGVLLDAPVSTGFTGGLVKRVASRLASFETALKERLRAAPVLHHDETPARVAADDQLLYVYTARAGRLVWFGAADNRGHDALDGFGILPGYRGTLVRDDYAGYAKYDKHLAGVQLCCAHLLRSLRGIGELDPDGSRVQRCWTEPVMSALTDAKAAVAKARAEGATAVEAEVLNGLRTRYDEAVAWGIATNTHRDWPRGRHPGYTLARRLQTRAAQVWRFTVDFAVPFTNNPCEQPQRMVKLHMKIGGCWRSVRTAARYCLIRSYLGTARNHGIHPLDALRDALAGNPWMPPQTA